jgi:hypothetical protein
LEVQSWDWPKTETGPDQDRKKTGPAVQSFIFEMQRPQKDRTGPYGPVLI